MEVRDVLQKLLNECTRAGGQKAWAIRWGLSPQHVNDVLNGRRDPGPGVLIPLGLQKIVTYAPLPTAIEPVPETMNGGVLLTPSEKAKYNI